MSDQRESADMAAHSAGPMSTAVFRTILERLHQFGNERSETEKMVKAARHQLAEIDRLWDELGGQNSPDVRTMIIGAVKQYGPRLITWIGGPAAGATAAAVLADDGAFSSIIEVVSGLF